MKLLEILTLLSALVALGQGSDITSLVFGKDLDGMPAAFGDFDSDELTDVFVLKNLTTVQVMFASNEEPLLQSRKGYSCRFDLPVTSVVPGDFDGDAFMDILVTTRSKKSNKLTDVYILWGGDHPLNCTDATVVVLEMKGQPLAIDYNHDMIIDLFGSDINNTRKFWIFNNDRTVTPIKMKPTKDSRSIKMPHSNAFLDLNNDFLPDLVVTTNKSLELWYGKESGFEFFRDYDISEFIVVGQSLYLDIELMDRIDLILPVCKDVNCEDSHIYVYLNDKWEDMKVNFVDNTNTKWGFAHTPGKRYIDTITMRGGDFNMDGYPDLLVTLKSTTSGATRSFLLENTFTDSRGSFNRTFKVRWNALNPFYNNDSVMAVFYDFYQDGILDVIFVLKDNDEVFRTAAFKNSLDYDANFVKVMVLTGRTNSLYPISAGSLGKKKRTYGTNLPGPSIAYKTRTQDGSPRSAIAAQLPQSAHFAMNLPFTIFGLGRTPNFIDSLTIGLSNKSRDWTQIIPNSQMVVIPYPPSDPLKWKVQLFVTPSKLILQSAAALTGTCGLITLIIAALYWKERREDKIEKLQEAHRFHFDAM
ncbi:T-cell immunomodulatory protein [Copidosoma floridanum]|uniref:T-cell immunomodulatory protein n=1 Tax=Copidosoma floridanum TaxID=29053 RepID=UPI0006C96FCF|nr:T-cell immunomodulatory protein [Copidosoma floridanum]XP_014208643.1 T-cell immunomodulatory protein [Copidosoma floridanum]